MTMLKHMFHDHPAKVGESYFEHMAFAFGFAARLFKAGFAAFVHGVVPCLHETTASAEVMAIHDEIRARRALMARTAAQPAAGENILAS
jgi:hypothetical protein